jgi:predicted kinase
MSNVTSQQVIVLMAGLPGVGKSTIAYLLGKKAGLVVVGKDILQSSALNAGIEGALAPKVAYSAMFAASRDIIRQGYSVVIDSPALYQESVEQAQALAAEAGCPLKILLCHTENTVRNERLKNRSKLRSQMETKPSEEDWRQKCAHILQLPPDLRLELDTTSSPIEKLVAEAASFLAR